MFCICFTATRKDRGDVQHRYGGHRGPGDEHTCERWEVPRGALHQERRQRHAAGGQLVHQRTLPNR